MLGIILKITLPVFILLGIFFFVGFSLPKIASAQTPTTASCTTPAQVTGVLVSYPSTT